MEQKGVYSREKTTVEIIYNGQPKKLIKETLYLDGVPGLTCYFEVDNFFQQYVHCYNCDNWVDFRQARMIFYPDKSACLECYPSIKRDLDTKQYHARIISGYLDELLLINAKTVINSDYETDSTFFNNYECCYFTGTKQHKSRGIVTVHLDHFIAKHTGHVGRIIGNTYPLYYKLNLSKSNKNPFEWINEKDINRTINADKWDQLINYFAQCYGLTLTEYKKFVYWCYDNPRKIEDIEKDGNCTSLELWRKSQ